MTLSDSFSLSLNKKLIISFILVSIIPLSVVALFTFELTQNSLTERITNQFESEAKFRTEFVKNIWKSRLEQISFLADEISINPVFATGVNHGENNDELNTMLQKNIERIWPELHMGTNHDLPYDFLVIDKTGKIITSKHKLTENDFSQDPIFVRGLEEKFYTFEYDQIDQNPMLVLISPILDQKDNHQSVLGVLIVKRDMTVVNKIMEDRSNLGTTGETYLVNSDKLIITGSRFIKNAAFNLKVDSLPVKECFEKHKSMSAIYPDYRDIPVFGVSQCESNLGFILLAEIDSSEMYLPVLNIKNQYLLIGIITAGIVGFISFLIATRISNPIVKLTKVSHDVSEGKLDVKIEDVKSKDEIGTLYRAFKEMMANLNFHITKIKDLNEELENANLDLKKKDKIKDEFIRVAAHELRTPIQPILGFISLARNGKIKNDEAINGILYHARNLKQLANNILDVSHIESGMLSYKMEGFQINKLIQEVVDSTKSEVAPDIVIETKLDKDISINGDRFRLAQVLNNIIQNSIKFTKKGKITIQTRMLPQQNKIEISISDTGPGIPVDILGTVFDKFVTKSVQEGTEHGSGLGLYISKAILSAHNGEIFASNNDDKGAKFTILLPL
ncbi:MAG: sensor histidine kinase [Candidatus Nitrosotenuis sp.]|nr:MAG: sensor histidine kinase [Candidatus Nitrosotenuis sp.]